ncbi:hypothetical protein NQ318_010493 [Aromia moschata]|uniref:C-CAP/cofactor C-like domain-containing protein n=1 Tax=Aromia moschata TaxID=1265417 RepID=A0AAV8YH44_9CUCU|nr:hypothetical protein NQ318_010493 [Aromia moschata]
MDIMDQKPNKLNILTKRELERQINLQKKKENKDLLSADTEKLGFFETIFAEKQNYIECLLNDSPNLPKSQLPDHFNLVSKEILTLQKYVAASTIFLRNYDLKRCQDILQELTAKAKDYEDEFLPKKKFGFKNKIKQRPSHKNLNGSKYDEVDAVTKPRITEINCGFFNRSNEMLTMANTDIFMKDISVEKLENLSTSIFAENCENCTLVIACQQLRLHNSKNIDIYLHVTSRAIMEDCKGIFVAPYNWKYEGIEDDFQNASLDLTVNNWRCIDDFNWLSEKHSPNWKEIDEKDRIKSWDDI